MDAWELAARAFEADPDARRWPGPLDLAQTLSPGTVRTPALELINDHLVWAATTPDARLIVTMSPQEGKSALCSRAFPVWLIEHTPDLRLVLGSYESGVARRLSRLARDDIHTHTDALGLAIRPDVSSQHEWQIDGHAGGMYAVGIGGALTSRPADGLIIDDPVKGREQADSATYRERAWDWWTETASTRLAPGAFVVVVLTRWHEDDLAGRLIAEDEALPEGERRWRVVRIPAQCEDPDTDPLGREEGQFMLSARGRTTVQWERIKRTVGARAWAALYQGRPAPLQGGVFQWAWIRPYRCSRGDVPDLPRVVVAVDTTGGGHDEAGIIAAGRGQDGRTYVLGDRSGAFTAGGQFRRAWFAVIDYEADELVYENNLVDPIMKRAIPAAWRRLRQQAQALDDAGLLDADPTDEQLLDVARVLSRAGAGDDDVASAEDAPTALAAQLRETLPYAQRILDSPEPGPARVTGVRATRGKVTRAEPVAAAYEAGMVSHVGVLPALEAELVTWQEGQASPNRLDADVWAWHALNRHQPARATSPVGSTRRVPTGATAAAGRARRVR
jgi:hypothetical protein